MSLSPLCVPLSSSEPRHSAPSAQTPAHTQTHMYIHVNTHMSCLMHAYMYTRVHVLMRHEKEGRKKVKQTTRHSNTAHPRQSLVHVHVHVRLFARLSLRHGLMNCLRPSPPSSLSRHPVLPIPVPPEAQGSSEAKRPQFLPSRDHHSPPPPPSPPPYLLKHRVLQKLRGFWSLLRINTETQPNEFPPLRSQVLQRFLDVVLLDDAAQWLACTQ